MRTTVFLFALLASASLGQDAKLPAREVTAVLYESFLRQVALANRPLSDAQVSAGLYRRTPQEIIGLSDREAGVLDAFARDYEFKSQPYKALERALRLEAVFESTESGRPLEALDRERQDLRDKYFDLVLDQIQKLKAALGDGRFQIIDAFIRSMDSHSPFFPILGGPKPTR